LLCYLDSRTSYGKPHNVDCSERLVQASLQQRKAHQDEVPAFVRPAIIERTPAGKNAPGSPL